MARKTWIPTLLLAVLVACATNPATGRSNFNTMSEAQEIALGKEADAQVRQEMGVYNDAAWQSYVNRVGQTMAKKSHRPSLPWSFAVVDAPAVNAFALPGGYIYLTRGILPFLRDEAEMANVLGHEIAHVTARHGAQAYSKQQLGGLAVGLGRIFAPERYQGVLGAAEAGLGLLFLKNGRDAEREADQFGVGYASGNGWDPRGMTGMLGTLARLSEASGSRRGVPNFLSTHPAPEDRIAELQTTVATAASTGSRTTNAVEFSRRLDGLVFGDSREQGMVRGRDFIHPIMRFSLRFPENWQIANGAEQVVAQPEGEAQAALLLTVVADASRPPAEVARAVMAQNKMTAHSGAATTINGLRAFVGTFSGEGQVVEAAFIASGRQTFLLAGLATEGAFNSARRVFEDTIGSFRPISQQEADAIQPDRVESYTVRNGDTWASIAQAVSKGAIGPASLAVMNGSEPGGRPAAGARIRVVVRR
jgi:predicted Zn-dependent protease